MPTINQLIKRAEKVVYKSKSPALGVNLNTLRKKETEVNSPQKEEYVLLLEQLHLRNLNSALRKVARVRLTNGEEGCSVYSRNWT